MRQVPQGLHGPKLWGCRPGQAPHGSSDAKGGCRQQGRKGSNHVQRQPELLSLRPYPVPHRWRRCLLLRSSDPAAEGTRTSQWLCRPMGVLPQRPAMAGHAAKRRGEGSDQRGHSRRGRSGPMIRSCDHALVATLRARAEGAAAVSSSLGRGDALPTSPHGPQPGAAGAERSGRGAQPSVPAPPEQETPHPQERGAAGPRGTACV